MRILKFFGSLKKLIGQVDQEKPQNADEGVSEVEDTRSIESLIDTLKLADPEARKSATKRLGEIGDDRAIQPLIMMLKDVDDDVRLEAVIALGKIGDPFAVEPLIEKLKSSDYFYVRKKAAYTLYTFYKKENLSEDLRQKIMSNWRAWYLT
jgi:HEAT repeat protein